MTSTTKQHNAKNIQKRQKRVQITLKCSEVYKTKNTPIEIFLRNNVPKCHKSPKECAEMTTTAKQHKR